MRRTTTKKGLLAAACTLPLALAVGCNDVGTEEQPPEQPEQPGVNDTNDNGIGDDLGDTWDDTQQEVEDFFATGGDTRCGDFIEQDEADQFDTVASYLEEEQDRTFESTDPEVEETTMRLLEVCGDPAEADTEIRDADTGGM